MRLFVWILIGLILYRLSRRSGVTDAEFAGPMPGDDLIADPAVIWTRATTIDAPPEGVWPWLVQMGFGRGGWYTSRAFDRVVWHVDNPSSDILIEEFQAVSVGDIIPDGPHYAAYFRVADIEHEQWIVYRSIRHPYRGHPIRPDPDALAEREGRLMREGVYLDFSWAWELRSLPRQRTRLRVRTRANYSPDWLRAAEIPLGLVDLYHVSTMFKGIAKRVSAHNGSGTRPTRAESDTSAGKRASDDDR